MSVFPHRPSIRIAQDTLVDAPARRSGGRSVQRKWGNALVASSHLRVLHSEQVDDPEDAVPTPAATQDANRQASQEAGTDLQRNSKHQRDQRASGPPVDCKPAAGANGVSLLAADAGIPQSVGNKSGLVQAADSEPSTASLPMRPDSFDIKNYSWFGLFLVIVLVFSSFASA
ncbi:hypothetical protein [Novipirellula caenicola]|uniref:hypothetical protein n=1 Tax=Novipirellula caenicola TaxID=1536901 RepID=UPI0031ECF510